MNLATFSRQWFTPAMLQNTTRAIATSVPREAASRPSLETCTFGSSTILRQPSLGLFQLCDGSTSHIVGGFAVKSGPSRATTKRAANRPILCDRLRRPDTETAHTKFA